MTEDTEPMTYDLSPELTELTPDQRELLLLRLAEASTQPARPERIPLSFTQEQLWFLDRMDPGTPLYNIPFALRLRGPLDTGALRSAVNAVVARQEALRIVFGENETGPYQLVRSALDIDLPVIDLRYLPVDERAAAATWEATEQGRVSFDLCGGPLVDTRLVVLDDEEHLLLTTVHHIVFDASSGEIFTAELVEYYRQFAGGAAADRPTLPGGFGDFAWQGREPAACAAVDAQLTHWRAKLAGAPATSTLRPDRPRPVVQTHRGGRCARVLPAGLTTAMGMLARDCGATLNAVALAGFSATLHQLTGQADLLFGMPSAGRSRVELEQLIGPFANMLVLRMDLAGDLTVRELVERAHRTVGEAYRHSDAPYARVVEAIGPPRDPGINPMFQILFTVAEPGSGTRSAAGVEFAPVPVDNQLTDFDLFVTLTPRDGECDLVVDYNVDLYLAETIELLTERVIAVLTGMVNAADATLGSVPELRRDVVALAGTFVVDLAAAPLRFWLDFCRAPASVEPVPYGQLVQHLLTGGDATATVGLLRWEDWLWQSASNVGPGAVLDKAMREFETAVVAYRQRTDARLILVRCPSSSRDGESRLFARLDDRLALLRERIPNMYVEWAEDYPGALGHDQDDLRYTPEYFAALATLAARWLPTPEPGPERAAYRAEYLADPAAVAERVAVRTVADPPSSAPIVEPSTPTEKRIATVWRAVLGIDAVGTNSNFFALGGHSLLVIQLLAGLQREFGRVVSLPTLFTNPTIAQLAVILEETEGPAEAPIEPMPPEAEPVASSIQQRLWATGQIDSADARHNTMFAANLRGALDISALERAVAEIVRRHEVLRTTFTAHRGRPNPVVHPRLSAWCVPVDLSQVPGDRRAALVADYLDQHSGYPYDLAAGPLLRVQAIRVGADEHHLLIGMHHIICDNTSWSIFLDELVTLYDAYSAGLPSTLPQPRLQFGDFAYDQQNWLGGSAVEPHIAYWREKLRGAPTPLELPGDRPDPDEDDEVVGRAVRRLPVAVGRAVRALARAESVTPYSVLLAAFTVLLYRESGQPDMVIGMPTSGRDRAELAGVIGCFADLLPLRLDLTGRPTFRRLVRRVHSTVRDALAHQRLPFPAIMETLRLPRDSSRHPLKCVLNYVDLPDEELSLSGLEVVPLPTGVAGADFDALFTLDWHDEQLRADLTYSAELFSANHAARLVERFGDLLAELVLRADTVIGTPAPQLTDPVESAAAIGLAASFPLGPVEPTLRFWSDLLGASVRAVTSAPAGQVLRPLLDSNGPFRGHALNVVLLRWEDWLTDANPSVPVAVTALEAVLAELCAAIARYRARTDAELVLGSCPASPRFADDRWAGIFGGLDQRLRAFAAEQPEVRVVPMSRWAERYGVENPCLGRDGFPYSAEFETVAATMLARWAHCRTHPPVSALVLDPAEFSAQADLIRVVRDQLRHGRGVVLTRPPSAPELAALVAVGTVTVGEAPESSLRLSPATATDCRSAVGSAPEGAGLATFVEHVWSLDGPTIGSVAPQPIPTGLVVDIATELNTAERIAVAVRSGFRRSARRLSTQPRTDRERTLAGIWAEVLNLAEVGIHDDFYELGGDSLLAITVAFHAAEAGIDLSARQLTERRTIAELDLATSGAVTRAAHEIVEGEVPLTPAQLWWFDTVATTMRNPALFNHPYYLELRRPIAVAHLAEAVRLLAAHHDSLRLRFRRDATGMRWQHHADVATAVPFTSHDLTDLPASELAEAMRSVAGAEQLKLDLTDGPTCRVLHLATGGRGRDRLLIVAHHLVVDAISRELLLNDLQTLCARLERGETACLPAKTTAYSAWARRLSTADMTAEIPFWLAQAPHKDTAPPPDRPGNVTTLATGRMMNAVLSAAETAGLQEATRRLRVTMRDLIVWGVAEAVAVRTGGRECVVATTGHGRENLFADVDLSRTTGWFQVMYPIRVRLPEAASGSAEAAAVAVAGQLATVPNNGIGYGMLEFFGQDPALRKRLAAMGEPRIAINYMGNFGFDEVSQVEELFDVCSAPYGDTEDSTGVWPYDLEVSGLLVGGRLRLDLGYGADVYLDETAAAFLDDLRARLLGLLG
ncbi:condensation domain-containing protein [Nocardia sp. NBC_01499]|uniref:condensation domain-containing protein n=1 Tax=Nocardia sp. NBC_01499 TaxID=2903597 RepID=UPI003865A4B2